MQTHRVKLKHSWFDTPNDLQSLNPNFLFGNSNTFEFSSLEYHYENEKRNSISYPIKGSFNEVILGFNKGFNNGFNNVRLTAKTENHFSLKPRLYFGNSIKIKVQSNTSLPYVLNESLGFEDYLRGYEYYVLDGEHFALAKTALKYEVIPKKKLEVPYFKMEQFQKNILFCLLLYIC